MAEVQFAKSFLAGLDGRPIKLSPDYAEDARRYPARSPYTLPSMKKAMRKPASSTTKSAAPGSAPAIAVNIKSMHRNPPLDVRLSSGDYTLATTSILDIRTALSEQTGVPLAKLKLLYNKKPVPDSKVLQDVAPDDAATTTKTTEIELGVMVSGGATTVAAAQADKDEKAAQAGPRSEAAAAEAAAAAAAAAVTEPTTAVSPSTTTDGKLAAETEEFWTDLHGYLLQRTKDAKHSEELFSLFVRAYDDRMI